VYWSAPASLLRGPAWSRVCCDSSAREA